MKAIVAMILATAAVTAQANVEFKAHPGDKGRYFIVEKTQLSNGDVRMVTRREGPSGTSFTVREFKCPGGEGSMHRMIAEGDGNPTKEAINANIKAREGRGTNWTATTFGSSTYYAHLAACSK